MERGYESGTGTRGRNGDTNWKRNHGTKKKKETTRRRDVGVREDDAKTNGTTWHGTLGASGRAFGLEVCEAQPLSAVVLGAENVTAWRLWVELVVGEETESDHVVVERADARSEKPDEGNCLHGGGGSGLGAGHAVAFVCVLQGHVEGLRVECLARSEDTARLRPRRHVVILRNLSDTIVTVCPLVVKRGALRARVHDCLATRTRLRLASLVPDGVSGGDGWTASGGTGPSLTFFEVPSPPGLMRLIASQCLFQKASVFRFAEE